MQLQVILPVLLLSASGADAVVASPIAKVLQLITDLQAKIVSEGEQAQKVYAEFAEFCEDRSRELENDIKTAKSEKEELTAAIAKDEADIESKSGKIEELSGDVAKDEADLKAAAEIRATEKKDFDAQETELTSIIDALERAINILEQEMRLHGASMLQTKGATGIAKVMEMLVSATGLSEADGKKLSALLQAQQEASEDDSEDLMTGAPAATVYEGHGGGIISTLENLLEKAKTQLSEVRAKETAALHNFKLLKQSLEDEISVGSRDLAEVKSAVAASTESKAVGEGALATTTKDLSVDTKSLDDLKRDCMTKAQDHQASTKSRGEELKAIIEAKRVIQEKTGGADALRYGLSQASFFQLRRTRLTSGRDLTNFEAVRLIRDLAHKQHSSALALLASKAFSVMHASEDAGADPYGKVKGLIRDMIVRLEEDADADASHKAYCDKELGESGSKKARKETQVEKIATRIEQDTARAAKLKEEVAMLQKSLSELTSAQAEMDKLRQTEREQFESNKDEMEKGLEGVKMALKVLRDYYAQADPDHSTGEGAGSGIIGLIEVCESDLSKSLAEIVATEESAKSAYESETKENAIEKTMKNQDLKYKEKEATSLSKSASELAGDKATVQAELDAILDYLKGLDQNCVAKAETYSERSARREAEVAGLKQAMQILDGEAVLLEQGSQRSLRGTRPHSHALA